MAGLTQKIELLITATNRTGSAFSAVGQGLDDMSANVRAVAQPFADVTTAVAKLDAVLAALAGAGLAYAFSESSKLQSSFTELKKVAGDNEAVLNTAKTAAKDLSNAYGESAADVLASTANYVQAGFSVEEAMGLAKTGMDLVIAGGVDASQSSEILIASLKGFKAPASEAERLIDILNETSNNYATDIEQLGRGMAGVSPIARTMGFSMEETAGIITPVIEVFRSGDEAAVALKTGLLKLIDDAKPVQEALASIGVAQRDANGNLRSGKDILYDVARAFQTLNPDQKLFVTQQLVGIDQSARMVEVFDGLSASTQITATAMQSAGSAAKEVAERMKDPEVAVNRLREGFNNLASAIGDEFQAGGASAINGFTGIINALQGEVEGGAFAPILDALDDFLNGLGEKFSTIAENLPEALEAVDYSGFLDSLGEIRDTIGGIFVDIDFEDPESLGNAIQGIIDTLTSLVDFSAEIADVFVSIGQKIGDLVGWFNALDGKTVATAGQITAFGAAVSAVAVPIGVVANAIAGLGGLLNTLSGSAVSTLVKSLVGSGSLSAAFTTVAPLAAAAFGGTAIGTLINEFVPGVKDGMQALAGMIDRYTGLLGVEKDAQKVREQSIEVEAKIKKITVDRTRAVEDSAQKTKAYFQEMVDSEDEAANGLEYLNEELRKTGALVEEEKKVTVDTKDAKKKFQELSYFVSEGEKKGWHTIKVPVDTTEVEAAKQKIEGIPAEKRLKFETDLQIAQVQAQAEIVQSSLKFQAEVNVAQIQADAETMKAAFDSVGESVKASAEAASSMFSALAGFEGTGSKRWFLEDLLEEQIELEKIAVEAQAELSKAQAEYVRARAERMESGEALITVDGAGLQPHLEMIMWELFGAIRIRATQEGLDQLLLGA